MMAATDTVPKRRYPAAKQAKQISFIRRFGPGTHFEKILRKEMGLPG